MFLETAVQASRDEARRRMKRYPSAALEEKVSRMGEPTDFMAAVRRSGGGVRMIAEVKRESPSAGVIRDDVSVAERVEQYAAGGASAVSVLTCGFKFGGSIEDLSEASAGADMPVLRKDFITDRYQVLEARANGASAVLLIAAALETKRIHELMIYTRELDMCSLVEAHGPDDLERALEAGAEIVGINNRDLRTLEVDLRTTEELLGLIPDGRVVISESGIRTREQVEYMEDLGVDGLLIGEALMRAEDVKRKLLELKGEVDEPCG